VLKVIEFQRYSRTIVSLVAQATGSEGHLAMVIHQVVVIRGI
jgi:hypothetical protein